MNGVKIKELRHKLFMTQAEFGKLLDVSEQTIRLWELNKKVPHLRNQKKIFDLCKENNIEI